MATTNTQTLQQRRQAQRAEVSSAPSSRLQQLEISNLERQMQANSLMRLGSSGPGVAELQQILKVEVTGQFDQMTHEAVMDFQDRYDLDIDGVVGGETWQTLYGLQCAGEQYAILFELATNGASATTAKQDGLRQGGPMASNAMAEADWERVSQYQQLFEAAAAEYDLPAALLMAIASRETRGGTALNEDGYSQYDGQGFGMMQVDKNHHTPQGGAFSLDHIRQAAEILRGTLDRVGDKFPDWSDGQKLQGAIAGYNKGSGRVRSWGGVDRNTTGGDYSSDVWARARHFAVKMGQQLRAGE